MLFQWDLRENRESLINCLEMIQFMTSKEVPKLWSNILSNLPIFFDVMISKIWWWCTIDGAAWWCSIAYLHRWCSISHLYNFHIWWWCSIDGAARWCSIAYLHGCCSIGHLNLQNCEIPKFHKSFKNTIYGILNNFWPSYTHYKARMSKKSKLWKF